MRRIPRPLGNRERQVLALTAAGYSRAEIAGVLFISGNTVKTHLLNAARSMQTTGPRSVAEALRLGYLDFDPRTRSIVPVPVGRSPRRWVVTSAVVT